MICVIWISFLLKYSLPLRRRPEDDADVLCWRTPLGKVKDILLVLRTLYGLVRFFLSIVKV